MDNFYCNCPPMMDDGRFITNYKSSWSNNEYIKYVNGIVRNDDYRQFLQTNADQLLNSEWIFLKGNDSCSNNACVHKYPLRMDPRLFYQERENANKLMESKELPNSFKCEKYPDYRLTNTGMSTSYVPTNNTKCTSIKNKK